MIGIIFAGLLAVIMGLLFGIILTLFTLSILVSDSNNIGDTKGEYYSFAAEIRYINQENNVRGPY